jgi:chemotaxis-related protein WspB
MLLLTYRAGGSLYAVEGRHVVEVVPRVGLRPIPHAPRYVLGLLSYRGQVVPVVDFGEVVGAGPSSEALSTRIVLTEFAAAAGERRRLGIVAEGVCEVVRGETAQAVLPGMRMEGAPYLGPVLRIDDRLVQIIRPEDVLSEPMREALYGDRQEAG